MFCIQHLNRRDDVDAVSVISVFVLVGEVVAEGGRASVAAIRIRFMNGRPPSMPVGRRTWSKQRPHFLHRIRQSRPRSWPRLQRLQAGRTEHEGGEGDRLASLTVLFSHSASCLRRTSQSQLNLDDAELHCARMLKTSRTWRTTMQLQGSPIYLN